jgi:hypothetical protein
MDTMRPTIPAEILSMGHARAAARRARDFREADRLKAAIEDAGFRVVDRGRDFSIRPAHPDDVVEADGRVRHGWSGSVPSRLAEPTVTDLSVVLVAAEDDEATARTLASLRAHAPVGAQLILVATPDATPDVSLAADGPAVEVVWTALPFRPAAARNAGARRAAGRVVAWIQPGVVLTGDALSPLVAALEDASVAVAGAVGLYGSDVRHLSTDGRGDAVAIDRSLLAFRRREIVDLEPIDERFFGDAQLDRWWSLVLRDGPDDEVAEVAEVAEGAGEDEGGPDAPDPAEPEPPGWMPRRAVPLTLPVEMSGAVELWVEPTTGEEAARRRKRDLYRLIDRFGIRRELLGGTDQAA